MHSQNKGQIDQTFQNYKVHPDIKPKKTPKQTISTHPCTIVPNPVPISRSVLHIIKIKIISLI